MRLCHRYSCQKASSCRWNDLYCEKHSSQGLHTPVDMRFPRVYEDDDERVTTEDVGAAMACVLCFVFLWVVLL